MNELHQLCIDRRLSLALLINPHKRVGLSPSEYLDIYAAGQFDDPAGLNWTYAMDAYDRMVKIEIYGEKGFRMDYYDVHADTVIADVIADIQSGFAHREDADITPIDLDRLPTIEAHLFRPELAS